MGAVKYEVEEINPVKRSLRIEIPQEVVAKEFALAYATLRQRIRLPGFRPGKAPISLLERRFGKEIEQEVVQKLVPDYYRQAVQAAGLEPVELPSIDRIAVRRDAPLAFTATFEVRPQITVTHYTGIVLERQPIRVTDEDVERALQHLREQHGQLERCGPEEVIRDGLYVIMNIEGFSGGVPLANSKVEGYLLEVGSQTLLPELEGALIGRKKGETFETHLTFPPDHRNQALAGKPITYQISILEVKRKSLPDPDDDFARDLGLQSIQALRAKLKQEIETRLLAERTSQEKEALAQRLVERQRFDVPPSMVEREYREVLARSRELAQVAGENPGEGDLEARSLQLAERRVRTRIILRAVARQEGLTVSDEEVDQELAAAARMLKKSPQEIKQGLLSRDGSLESIRGRLLEQKALEFIHSKAVFEEKS